MPTYINHSQLLIPDGIHFIFWTKFERKEEARPFLICWALNKETSGTTFITSLVMRGREQTYDLLLTRRTLNYWATAAAHKSADDKQGRC